MKNYIETENRLLFALLTSLFSIFAYFFWIGFGEYFFNNNIALFSISGQVIFFGTIPLLFNKLYKSFDTNLIRFSHFNLQLFPFLLLLFVGIQILISSSTSIQEYLIPSQYFDAYREVEKLIETNYSSIMKFDNIFNVMITILMIVAVPAIFEELFFRKFLLNELIKKVSPYYAISVTSFIFSIIHFNPIHIVQLFVFGFILGIIAYKTKNIIYSILLHFLNNGLSLTAYYFSKSDFLTMNQEYLFDLFLINLILLGLGIIIILFSYKKILYLTKNENENTNNDEGDYEKI